MRQGLTFIQLTVFRAFEYIWLQLSSVYHVPMCWAYIVSNYPFSYQIIKTFIGILSNYDNPKTIG